MTPAVEAALISGGWATAVAALGYFYNRATANATIRATNANAMTALDAAHASQHWEKRGEAYLEAIATVTRQQGLYRRVMSNVRFDEETEKKLREAYEEPEDWDWAAASARLAAYGSLPVLHAMHLSQVKRLQVAERFKQFTSLAREARSRGLKPGDPGSERVVAARRSINDAIKEAESANSALEVLIRADLAHKPSDPESFAQLAEDLLGPPVPPGPSPAMAPPRHD